MLRTSNLKLTNTIYLTLHGRHSEMQTYAQSLEKSINLNASKALNMRKNIYLISFPILTIIQALPSYMSVDTVQMNLEDFSVELLGNRLTFYAIRIPF